MVSWSLSGTGQPPAGALADFGGRCANCPRLAAADDLEARCAEAVEARDNLRETDKRETRLFVQTHPDVLIIPPDPPQMMIKVDQVRHVIQTIYYRPGDGRERVYIFTDSAFMKEAANSLLKVLEELRVPVDLIVGTSMGSIVGGSYASGMTVPDMEAAIKTITTASLFSDKPPRSDLPPAFWCCAAAICRA